MLEALKVMGVKNPDNNIQGHGMTVGQMKEHQKAQGENRVEMISGNCDESYKMPWNEAHLMHVSIQQKGFNPKTGKREYPPRVQIFYVKDFEDMSRVTRDPNKKNDKPENAFHNDDVKILHDPRLASKSVTKKQAEPKADITYDALAKMSITDLRELHKQVFAGEEAEYDDTVPQLVVIIAEKMGLKADKVAVAPKK